MPNVRAPDRPAREPPSSTTSRRSRCAARRGPPTSPASTRTTTGCCGNYPPDGRLLQASDGREHAAGVDARRGLLPPRTSASTSTGTARATRARCPTGWQELAGVGGPDHLQLPQLLPERERHLVRYGGSTQQLPAAPARAPSPVARSIRATTTPEKACRLHHPTRALATSRSSCRWPTWRRTAAAQNPALRPLRGQVSPPPPRGGRSTAFSCRRKARLQRGENARQAVIDPVAASASTRPDAEQIRLNYQCRRESLLATSTRG